MAIGSSFDLLTTDRWESAELLDVIALALAPHGGLSSPRFDVQGPELRLTPNKALSMAMVLHELATNALKYGALSVPSGRIEVAWAIDVSRTPEFNSAGRRRMGCRSPRRTRRGFGLVPDQTKPRSGFRGGRRDRLPVDRRRLLGRRATRRTTRQIRSLRLSRIGYKSLGGCRAEWSGSRRRRWCHIGHAHRDLSRDSSDTRLQLVHLVCRTRCI